MGLFDAITSLFTPPGTNDALDQWHQQQQVMQLLLPLLQQSAGYQQSLMNFQNQQLPTAENAVTGLGQYTTQQGRNQLENSYGQYARGQAQTQAGQAGQMFANNPALAKAFGLAAMNRANGATTQYANQINSPQGQMQAYQTYMQGLQGLQPNSGNVLGYAQGVYGAPHAPVGQGFGGTLGSIIGMIPGGSWAKLFGMGGGSRGGGDDAANNGQGAY
ncbi:MAG TPA: hypothetical protein VG944_08675 [Fimbriimonas sp.]|nr:hypothetical protein [Fimbriimonas sp.]